MSGKIIKSEWLREDPFFEIAGFPGRLYLEAFSFGADDPLEHLRRNDLDLRSPERSPLTLFPDPKRRMHSSLLSNLNKLRSAGVVYDVAERIGSCSIGAEWTTGGRPQTNTIYLFFKCDLRLLRLFGVGDLFRIEFLQLQRVGEFLTKRSW